MYSFLYTYDSAIKSGQVHHVILKIKIYMTYF